jgi:transposase
VSFVTLALPTYPRGLKTDLYSVLRRGWTIVHHLAVKAYSVDLREKIIAAVGRGMSKAQAARTFGVGATSVKRYVKLAEEGKPLTPGKAPGKKGKLDGSAMKLLKEDLHSRPAVTYEKRADLLCELLGLRVSKSTICRMVRRLGYTRKKDRWGLQKEMNGSERPGRLR